MAGDYPRQDRRLDLPRERLGKREVTGYSPELALQIVERVASGETISAVCAVTATPPMPAATTFRRWVLMHPELMRAYEAAKELKAHSLFDEALDMARHIRDNPGTAQKVRAYDIALQHIRWTAGKLAPHLYSERSTVQFTVPIQINTTVDLGQGASAAKEVDIGDFSYTLEAQVVDGVVTGGEQDGGVVAPLRKKDPRGRKPGQKDTQPRKRAVARPAGAGDTSGQP